MVAASGDARQSEEQCQRQGALVERGEDGRLVDARAVRSGRSTRVDRRRSNVAALEGHPRRVEGDDLSTPGSSSAAASPARSGEERDVPRARGDRPNSRTGEQHVTGVVEAGDEHVAPVIVPSR